MAAFPISTTDHLLNFKSRSVKTANRQTSSAGYPMSFANATVAKEAFKFTLFNLSNTDRETLQTFFDTNQGTSFTIDFTCTGDTTTYTTIFDQDEIEFNYVKAVDGGATGKYTLDLSIKEV